MKLNKQKVSDLKPKGWDDTKLAAEVGISHPYLMKLYNGERTASKDVTNRLIKALGSKDIFSEE